MARLCTLFSGSTGNSTYIGSPEEGLLIDVGRSARQTEHMLQLCGIPLSAIRGILITHEHSDHISGLRVFARKHSLPVYASPGTLSALGDTVSGGIPVTGPFSVGEMHVTPFHTSHDCAEGLGFRIVTQDQRQLGYCTDCGVLTDEVQEHLLGCETVVIESNHDVEKLRTGPYPYYLQQRILSDRGHLSNAACDAFLPQLYREGARRFVLAHLSRENNTPALAYQGALAALEGMGLIREQDFLLEVAPVENGDGRIMRF